MPVCQEHGQVYGEGGQCATCAGQDLKHHDPNPVATQLSADALTVIAERFETLEARIAALESK